jgi:hypothetical protein
MADIRRDRVATRMVEGITIVISILLAFAIDAGWDRYQENARASQALVGLRGDFEVNRARMDDLLDVHRARADAHEWFQRASPDDILALPPDSATTIYRLLYTASTFDGVRAQADALVGAGDLGLITDPALRRNVTAFLRATDDLAEDAARVNETGLAFLEATMAHGGPWNSGPGTHGAASSLSTISVEELRNLRADPVVQGIARLSHHVSTVYLVEIQELSAIIDSVLAALSATSSDEGSI